MEEWIGRNQNKLLFVFLAIMAWSCVSVVRDGGAVIPRIEMLENHINKIYELEKIYTEHTHYYNGKPR